MFPEVQVIPRWMTGRYHGGKLLPQGAGWFGVTPETVEGAKVKLEGGEGGAHAQDGGGVRRG